MVQKWNVTMCHVIQHCLCCVRQVFTFHDYETSTNGFCGRTSWMQSNAWWDLLVKQKPC